MSAEKDAFDAYREQVLKALSDSRNSGGLKSQLTQLQKNLLSDVQNTSNLEEYNRAKTDLNSIKEEMTTLATEVEELERLLSSAQSLDDLDEEHLDLTQSQLQPVEAIVEPASPQSTFPPASSSLLRNRNRPEVASWSVTPSDASKTPVNPHRADHDELTIELLQMARRLKQNNLALHEMVKKDHKVMEDTDMAMATNTTQFDAQHKELKAFSSSSWATTWKLIIITLVVVISIIFMFMLILITRSR